MVNVLAIVLAALLADPFLPAFEYAKRPAAEWIEEFETSGLLDRDALWCVYHHGDRSTENLERLTSWWRRTTDERVKLDLATILNHWDACPPELEFEEVFTPALLADGRVPILDSWLGPPFALLEGSADELLAIVRGDEPVLRARAAVTLACRRDHVDEVVRVLTAAVNLDLEGNWRGRAPDAWEDVLGTVSSPTGPRDAIRSLEIVTPREITGLALSWVRDAVADPPREEPPARRTGAHDPQAVESWIRVLEDRDPSDYERAEAAEFLAEVPLTAMQQARIARPGGWMLDPWSLGKLWARQGEVCLEGVPVLREAGSFHDLQHIFRITRPLPEELFRVRRALETGKAGARRQALEALAAAGLDAEDLGAAFDAPVAADAPARTEPQEATFRVVDAMTDAPIERFGLVFGEWVDAPPKPGELTAYDFPDGVARWSVALGDSCYAIDAPGYAPASGVVRFDGPGRRCQILRLLRLGAVRGRLVSVEGRDVTGAQVWVQEHFGMAHRIARAQADGSFELPELTPGRYDLIVWGPGAGCARVQHVRIDPGRERSLGEISLHPSPALRGRVQAAPGDPAEGVILEFRDATWKEWVATTDADGGFEFPDVPPGDYTVWFGYTVEERKTIDVELEIGETRALDLDGSELAKPLPLQPMHFEILVNGAPHRRLAVVQHAGKVYRRIGFTDGDGRIEAEVRATDPLQLGIETPKGVYLAWIERELDAHEDPATLRLDLAAGSLVLELPEGVHVPEGGDFFVHIVPDPSFPGDPPPTTGVPFSTDRPRYDVGLVPAGTVVVRVTGILGTWSKRIEIVAGQENLCRLTAEDTR